MPSNGDRLLASTGDCSPAALASPYSETAWKKLYPIRGHISSSIVHSARPLRISHPSLTSSGRSGAFCMWNVSGEGKKDILQASIGNSCSHAEIVQRSRTTNMPTGKENEAVTDPLSVHQLMDCNGDRPALVDLFAQHTDNF